MAIIKFASSVLKDSYKSFTGVFNNPNRIYGLDILRAIAIMLVVYQHGLIFVPHTIPSFFKPFAYFDGVTVFFVLSGFLIGQILIKNIQNYKLNRNLILNFWMRRWLRTLPLYYFFLVLNIILARKKITEVKEYFVFSQNIKEFKNFFFQESWSLSVEEWFYFFIPIIIYLIIRLFSMDLKRIIPFLVIIIMIYSYYYTYKVYQTQIIENWDDNGRHIRNTIMGSIHLIIYGLLGAWLKIYKGKLWNLKPRIFICLIIVTWFIRRWSYGNYGIEDFLGGLLFQNIPAIIILLSLPILDKYRKKEGVIFKLITFISIISYSMYLVHSFVNIGIMAPLTNFSFTNITSLSIIIKYIIFISITMFISFLTYIIIELPFMRLRENKKIKSLFQRTQI